MSLDYGPAVWRPQQVNGYYTPANRPNDIRISRVTIHYTAGESFPVIFAPGGSTHYGIARDGRIDQYVREKDIAWADGVWPSNQISLSIEHQGFGRPSDWTDAMLDASARLVGNWVKKYKIPADRQHILGHSQVNTQKSDPGPYFPWDRYMALVRKYAGQKDDSGKLYRVQVGAYGEKKNADAMMGRLKAAGYSGYVKFDGKLYRVQVGAFSVKANADWLAAELKKKGFPVYVIES